MQSNFSRYLRAPMIAALALLLVAGAAFAASGVPLITTEPANHPAADASGSPVVDRTHAPEALEASESPEAARSADADKAEASESPEADETHGTDKDTPGDDESSENAPGASAGATLGDHDGTHAEASKSPKSSASPAASFQHR